MDELFHNFNSMDKYQLKEENINLATSTTNPIDQKPNARRTHQIAFGNDPFSDDEQRHIRQKLDMGLSREDTAQRPGPGGIRVTYIEGWKAIHVANEIFGFNGWSSEIVNLDLRFVEEARGRFSACASATVRITLRDGCTREDRGGGIAENMRSRGEAILKAEKEAITDAKKRALKNFGLRLGLALYDRQYVRDMNKMSMAKDIARNQPPQQNSNTRSNTPRNVSRYSSNTPQTSNVPPNSNHPSFQHDQSSNQTNTNAAPAVEMTEAIAAQVAAKRKEAILRQQALHRARAKQAAASNQNLTDKGFQNQLMHMNGMMMQINGQSNNAPRASSGQQSNTTGYTNNLNSLSARSSGLSVNGSRPINTNGNTPATEQEITKQIRQSLHASMAQNIAGFPQANPQHMRAAQNNMQQNSAQARVTGTATGIIPHQNGDVSLELSATINRRRNAAQNSNNGDQHDEAIALSLKQTEIEELNAIALATEF